MRGWGHSRGDPLRSLAWASARHCPYSGGRMIYVINQPWDGRGAQMGHCITLLLTSETPRFELFRVCVAFAKASGVLRLAPAFRIQHVITRFDARDIEQ